MYKQKVLMLRLKRTTVSKSRCLHFYCNYQAIVEGQ